MSTAFKKCSSCGAIRDANDLYCGYCGKPIDDGSSTFVRVSTGPGSNQSSGTTILASSEATTLRMQDQKVFPATKLDAISNVV